MEFSNNPIKLFRSALALFLLLTLFVAILPALHNQEANKVLPGAPVLTPDEQAGKQVFIANGCVACHTQQVRDVEMDKPYGIRASVAADYAGIGRSDFWRNTATLMGTERTGPDLSDIGRRQPSREWHLLHLYQPRAVVEQSVMPAYPWLFEIKEQPAVSDVKVTVPARYNAGKGTVVARPEALQLMAYLLSLKQLALPGSTTGGNEKVSSTDEATQVKAGILPDGRMLYAQNCQSCHQANGEGLPGAFPPLKGSPVVNGDDLDVFVGIIMQGYDPRTEFASMPAVGTNNQLSPEAVTAIINHEKSSWGNRARPAKLEEVKRIMESIRQTTKQ